MTNLTVLVDLQLGDDNLAGVDANVHRLACTARLSTREAEAATAATPPKTLGLLCSGADGAPAAARRATHR